MTGRGHGKFAWRLCCLVLVALLACASDSLRAQTLVQPHIRSTPSGIRFGIVGEKGAVAVPAVVIFVKNIERTLEDSECNRLGMLLRLQNGCVLVSLDIPAHGADRRQNEPAAGLSGWAKRVAAGEDFIAPFLPKVSAVLDFLVANGTVDPGRIGVYGVSRGGFLALYFAAAEPRVKWCAAFAPVTDLLALEEFHGMNANAMARSLSLERIASRLTARPIWIAIGNNDDRVGTDNTIRFSRRVVEESLAQGKPPDLELHVTNANGHSRAAGDWEAAAAWALHRF
jgi:dienelactone hydrolase